MASDIIKNLPLPLRELALKRSAEQHPHRNQLQRENSSLWDAFNWESTPEGDTYWRCLVSYLEKDNTLAIQNYIESLGGLENSVELDVLVFN